MCLLKVLSPFRIDLTVTMYKCFTEMTGWRTHQASVEGDLSALVDPSYRLEISDGRFIDGRLLELIVQF